MVRIHSILLFVLIWQPVVHAGGFTRLFRNQDLSAYDGLSCHELYYQVMRTEPQSHLTRHPLINEQTDAYMILVGSAAQPAFYYYGVSIPWQYRQEYRAVRAGREMDYLRRRMADLHCFEKY